MAVQVRVRQTARMRGIRNTVELLLLGPLGAADEETVEWVDGREGNAGCKAAAMAPKGP
jgi:hypothetical protein